MKRILFLIFMAFVTLGLISCTGDAKITISFNSNGGNEIETIEVNTNQTSLNLPEPVRSGYTFEGWFLDEGLTQPFTIGALLTNQTLMLYAKWSQVVVTYTMTFESNGGSAVSAITLAAGASVSAPTAPTKEGYTFGGWYSDVGLTSAYTFTTMPAENITLYAKWNLVVVQSTMSFESNGGSAVASITQNVGSTVVAPTAPTRTGYTFSGWYSDIGLTTAYTVSTMPAQNITLYAKWTINQYTITFNSNGGSAVTAITQNFGTVVLAPSAPTREGYTFDGWYSNTELTTAYAFTTMPAQNITLYAKWTINQYTITFNSNGGSAVTAITQNFGTVVLAPSAPTREGYTFDGWYSNTELTTAYAFTTMPAQNITLYAKWTINQYTITFNSDGGSTVTAITQNFGTVVTAPAAPTKEGYTFGGWYSNTELTTAYAFTIMPAQNITLYAKWTVNQYTITFNSNGGSAVTTITQNYGTAVLAPSAPTREGYTFDGWYSNTELTTAYAFTTMPAQNITLYAKWIVNQYTITFNSNGGSTVTSITQNFGSAITAPTAPTREGYTFDGWFSNVELTTAYAFTTMPAQNITLYAKWAANQYTITFNSNGGSTVTAITQNFGSVVTAPTAPTREGYTFDGWYSNTELTTAYAFTTMPAQNITLYAKWEVLVTYDLISDILLENPTHVKVRGVIYYKYPLPMNPGFYIYDGTGYIYVLSSTEFAVGQGVEFEADFSYFEYTPQLTNVTNLAANSSFTTMPTYENMDLIDIAHSAPNTLALNGKPVIIDGLVQQFGMQYVLLPNFSDSKVFINFKSYQGLADPFFPKVGTRIQIHAVIQGFSPMQDSWHILYQPSSPIVDIVLTDQEKVAEILAKGIEELDGKIFYSGATLNLPNTDPYYSSTILFETMGDNASFLNTSTGQFSTTEIERAITLRITVTIGLVTNYVDVTIHLHPISTISIQDFKALYDMSYGVVSGVVIFASSDMKIIIIADETGTLAVMCNSSPQYGDLVIVGGYRAAMDGLVIMADESGNTLKEILSNNQEIPIDPLSLSVDDFNSLDPSLPTNWIIYVEITGSVYFDDMTHNFYLDDVNGDLMILAMTTEGRNLLSNYFGFKVKIKGLIFPNFDEGANQLMFVFGGHPNDIEMALSDEELIVDMSLMLKGYLEGQTYYPGQTIELPLEHPYVPITVSYQTSTPALINLLTNQISEDISEPMQIVLEATLTLGIYQEIVLITLTVEPLEILSVQDFIATNGEVSAYVVGVVIFKVQEFNTFYLIADETGILFVPSLWNLEIGTKVLVYGEYFNQDNMPFIRPVISPDPVVEIIAFDQPMPMAPIVLSLTEFIALGISNPYDMFKYYQLEGVLSKLGFDNMYMLDDGIAQVAVFAPLPELQATLDHYLGIHVLISGLGLPMGDEPQMMIVFLGLPNDISLGGDPEEIYTMISNDILNYYASKTFIQGVYHQLPQSLPGIYELEYNKGINGLYYNLETGWISEDISSEMYIEIHVTLTVGDYFDTFDILIHVVPVEALTISQFKAGDLDTLYLVRGVVVYSMFYGSEGGFFILADHTGYLIVPFDLELSIGTECLIEAMVDTVMGVKTMKEGTITVYSELGFGVANPLVFTPKLMEEIVGLNPEDPSLWGRPIELIGYIIHDEFEGIYFTDSLESNYQVKINTLDYDLYYELMMYSMLEIKLKGYLVPNMNELGIDGFMLFVGVDETPVLLYETDQEKMDALITLGEYAIQGPIVAKVYLELPDEIDVLGATLYWTQVGGPMIFDPTTKYVSNVPSSTVITLRATVTIGSLTQMHDFMLEVLPFVVLNIPNYEHTTIDGLFPGLIVYKADYRPDYLFGGTYFGVDLVFPYPESIGASHFILQYYDVVEEMWKDVIYQGEPLSTYYYNTWEEAWMNANNFSLPLAGNTMYRLRAVGTPEAMYSNEVYVMGTTLDTQFTGWNMDGSMYLTGVMMPQYGHGLQVSATVYNNETYELIENAVIYEWYRVNPYTFEMTLILGADDDFYVTTFEDIGYLIMARIKGDGISAGGYIQIMSWETVKIFNPTRLISYDSTGFTLEFSHLFNPSDLWDMIVYDEAYQVLEITDINPTMDPLVFEFVVDLSDTAHVSLELWTYTWFMGKSGFHEYHWGYIEFDL